MSARATFEAENAKLRATVAQQQQVLHQRGEPLFLAVMDALDVLCQMAEQGHPQARELLKKWNATQQRAQDAVSGLTVVRSQNGPPPEVARA